MPAIFFFEALFDKDQRLRFDVVFVFLFFWLLVQQNLPFQQPKKEPSSFFLWDQIFPPFKGSHLNAIRVAFSESMGFPGG